jgi:hypothetical protein
MSVAERGMHVAPFAKVQEAAEAPSSSPTWQSCQIVLIDSQSFSRMGGTRSSNALQELVVADGGPRNTGLGGGQGASITILDHGSDSYRGKDGALTLKAEESPIEQLG